MDLKAQAFGNAFDTFRRAVMLDRGDAKRRPRPIGRRRGSPSEGGSGVHGDIAAASRRM